MAWAAAAATQMVAFGIPWGGSMAFRTDLLARSNVLDKWANSLCEDVPLERVLHRVGLRLDFVLAATMVNCERIDLKRCSSSFAGKWSASGFITAVGRCCS